MSSVKQDVQFIKVFYLFVLEAKRTFNSFCLHLLFAGIWSTSLRYDATFLKSFIFLFFISMKAGIHSPLFHWCYDWLGEMGLEAIQCNEKSLWSDYCRWFWVSTDDCLLLCYNYFIVQPHSFNNWFHNICSIICLPWSTEELCPGLVFVS